MEKASILLVSKYMHMKPQQDTFTHSATLWKLKSLTALRDSENMERPELSLFTCECIKGCNLSGTLNVSLLFIIHLSYDQAIPLLIYSREIKTCPQKDLSVNVHSFSHDSPKLEATQMSVSRRMDKLWCTHRIRYDSAVKSNKLTTLQSMDKAQNH